MNTRWMIAGALILIGLGSSGCSGEDGGESGSGAGIEVPDLPDYVSGFDPSVRQLVEEAHRELRADASDPNRWMKLGMAFEAHSEAGQAVPLYEEALVLAPNKARWWYRLAMARQGSDQLEAALEAMDQVVALNDRYAPAHWRRGLWLLETAKEEEARASFQRSLQVDPQDPAGFIGLLQVSLRLGENEEVIRRLEGSPLLRGPNGPWASKLLGTAYQRSGREEEARVLLANSKEAKPVYRDAWNSELDQYRRGLASINRQARNLIAAGQAPQAITILERAREQDGKHVPILRTLGAAYAAAGRTKDALEVLLAAADLEPENTELRIDAAWAYAMHGELQSALSEVLEILGESPENNKAHVLHAQLLMDLGRNEEAIAAFAKAMEHGARQPAMLVDIGKKQLELGQLPEALTSFVLAGEQDPASTGAFIGQAIVQIELKELDAAGAALERAEALAKLQQSGADPVIVQIRNQIESLRQSSQDE